MGVEGEQQAWLQSFLEMSATELPYLECSASRKESAEISGDAVILGHLELRQVYLEWACVSRPQGFSRAEDLSPPPLHILQCNYMRAWYVHELFYWLCLSFKSYMSLWCWLLPRPSGKLWFLGKAERERL